VIFVGGTLNNSRLSVPHAQDYLCIMFDVLPMVVCNQKLSRFSPLLFIPFSVKNVQRSSLFVLSLLTAGSCHGKLLFLTRGSRPGKLLLLRSSPRQDPSFSHHSRVFSCSYEMTKITISNQSQKSYRKYKSENGRTRTSEYIRGGIRCHGGVSIPY
jgi:hypothetical protein